MKLKHWHGIVAAAVVAFLAVYLLEMRHDTAEVKQKIFSALVAIFIGVLVEVICLLIMDLRRLEEARVEAKRSQEETCGLIRKLESDSVELWAKVRERVDRDESLHEVMHYGRPGFSPDEMTEAWLYLLSRLKTSYIATNYIDSHKIYNTNWGAAALLIQNGKKEGNPGFLMRKVFLVNSDSELLDLGEYIEQQRQIKAEVHYLDRKKINESERLRGQLDSRQIPSVDFGVFDSRTVLVWELNEDRTVKGGTVLYGAEHVEKHSIFFEDLFKKAVEYSRDRFVVVQVPKEYLTSITRSVDSWKADDGKGYTGDYGNIDYSLRLDGGWLTQFGREAGTVVYAAYKSGIMVGFSLLTGQDADDKEFYVAIHPGHLGRKLGNRLTKETLRLGFTDLKLQRIHLKVRLTPEHRVKMYSGKGFERESMVTEKVNGIDTEFYLMAITKAKYEGLLRQGLY